MIEWKKSLGENGASMPDATLLKGRCTNMLAPVLGGIRRNVRLKTCHGWNEQTAHGKNRILPATVAQYDKLHFSGVHSWAKFWA